jgi:hypothetical protein
VVCAGETAYTAADALFPGKLGATRWPTEMRDLFAPQAAMEFEREGRDLLRARQVRTKQLIIAACQQTGEYNRDAEEDFKYDWLIGPKNPARCVLCKSCIRRMKRSCFSTGPNASRTGIAHGVRGEVRVMALFGP